MKGSGYIQKGELVALISPSMGKVRGVFLVEEKMVLETKRGDPYIALILYDASGRIDAKIWDGVKEMEHAFQVGDFVLVEARVQEFRSKVQLNIESIERINPKHVDMADFLPTTPFDTEKMWEEFKGLTRYIENKALRNLVKEIFSQKDMVIAMKSAPAAKRMHHAYLGGLLEHSISVTKMAKMVCNHYEFLNRDLMIAGAMLHDIGKIEEFSYDRPPIDYTDKGRLLGHMVIGVNIIERFSGLLGLDEDLNELKLLKHMILSHHGQREFGSPVLPMTQEAMALHLIDDLDAKLNYISGLKEDNQDPHEYSWTKYQHIMERHFFLPGLRCEDNGESEEQKGPDEGLGEEDIQDTFVSRQKRLLF